MKIRGLKQTDYVGHSSKIRWLSSVQAQTEQTGAERCYPPYRAPGSDLCPTDASSDTVHTRSGSAKQNIWQESMEHMTDSSFYLDSSNTDIDIVVDPYEVPDPEVAERLFDCYMDKVHYSFPLVRKSYPSCIWCQY